MISFQIKSNKIFMNQFLTGKSFHSFLLEEASITTYNNFHIDGRIRTDFYSATDLENGCCPYEFSLFSDVQDICFSLIKGTRAPLFFKFILMLLPESMEKLLANGDTALTGNEIQGFVVTVKFEESAIILTTAVSYKTFVLDKSADVIWDNAFRSFLAQKEFEFEEI